MAGSGAPANSPAPRQHILDFSHGRPSGYTAEGPDALQKHPDLLRSDRGADLDDLNWKRCPPEILVWGEFAPHLLNSVDPSCPGLVYKHTGHDLSRFTAIRAARASFLLETRSPGMSVPVPKYISSGVWPRNAECGRRVLCSAI